MKKYLILILFAVSALLSYAQVQNPAKWSYSVKELSASEVDLVFTCKLDAGWHIYSQYTDPAGPIALEFTIDEGKDFSRVGKVREPKAHEEFDETFGCTVKSFTNTVTFRQKVKRNTEKAFKVTGSLYYQLCNDGSCIAPSDVPFTFNVPVATMKEEAVATDTSPDEIDSSALNSEAEGDSVAAITQSTEENNDGDVEDEEEKSNSLFVTFLLALLGGIVTMFTPCVFPMIPMTVNFFMHGSDNKRKNRRQAWFFGFSIIFIFAVLGAILSFIFGPESLNYIGTHGIPNLIFFVIFFIFALSFFGLFEIKMPEKWINKSDEQADKGGLMAPFFIALTTVLVSFSCTGPIIGGALVGLTTESTNRWVALVTMLGFGIGFALPFTLLAFFPQVLKNMKSGGWLNTVKVSFAFLELAFGLKFLSMADQYWAWRLLDREVYLALWIVIFSLWGIYLMGKIKFKGDEDVKQIGVLRLFLIILDFSFVVYMIPGMWGAPLKGISGYLPPEDTQDFNIERLVVENTQNIQTATVAAHGSLPADRKYVDVLHLPVGFEGFYDLDEAKAWAKEHNKPIFIDFTGRNCANCRKMENAVWVDPEVKKILNEDFIICSLFADMNDISLPENEWIPDDHGRMIKTLGRRNLYYQTKTFNMNAQPYYVIIDSEGNVMTKHNFKYERDVNKFIHWLNEGKANYANKTV